MKAAKWMLLMLAGSFAALLVELRYFHAGIWGQNPVAYIPVATCGVALVCCLAALAAERKLAVFLGWVLILCSLSGVAGVHFHSKSSYTSFEGLLQSNVRVDRLEKGMKDQQALYQSKPLVAPLSITGLALMAAILIFSQKKS